MPFLFQVCYKVNISLNVVELVFYVKYTVLQVPGLPLTPTLSIFFNLYLMFLMDLDTWIRFATWLAAGKLIFRQSKLYKHTIQWCVDGWLLNDYSKFLFFTAASSATITNEVKSW